MGHIFSMLFSHVTSFMPMFIKPGVHNIILFQTSILGGPGVNCVNTFHFIKG